jgi:acyl carrier protein
LRDSFNLIEKIKREDSFFEIGGYSLYVLKAHSKLQNELNLKFQITLFFEYPTIASLSKALSGNDKKSSGDESFKKRADLRKKMLFRN